jgi:hypothetical protein
LKTGRTGILGLWVINRPGTVELTEDSGFFYRILRGALGAAERAAAPCRSTSAWPTCPL